MPALPRLYLIDGHALAYRTYFALTGLGGDNSRWVTKSGEPTAGTYGFTAVLLRFLESDPPEYLAVSFDVGRTFRDDLYPAYKGTREKMPDDLAVQIKRLYDVVAAFNIPILTAEGYEADDVLGTVARRAAAQGLNVKIITGDRDLLQLAAPNITINLAGQKLSEAVDYGPAQVEEKYGLTPAQFIDYKALVGDTSDNIPGVAGVGEKTATSLLQTYGTLDNIYANLAQIPTRFRTKLEAGRELAYLSLKLSTIVTDLDLPFDLEACRTGDYNREELTRLFQTLEFSSLLKRLPGPAALTPAPLPGQQMALFAGETPAAAPAESPTQASLVTDADGLAALVRDLSEAPYISLDTETTSTDPMRAALVGISLSTRAGHGYYIPVGHTADPGPQLPLAQVLEALRPALTDPHVPKYGHNFKYDFILLARHGLRPSPLACDTMLAEWASDPGSHSLGLKKLAFVRLGVTMTEIDSLLGRGKKQITMDQLPVAQVGAYAAADADLTARLVPGLLRELEERQQTKLLRELEMPLALILADMEMAGITLDGPRLTGLSGQLTEQLARLEQSVYEHVGYTFNINSTQQLSDALFGKLQLQPADSRARRKTAAGKFSTAADVLEDMRDLHPVIALILEQRELSKLKSTYLDALPLAVNPDTGRVHTSYSQTGAVTGRLASSDPNLQNIPVRTDLGRQVRRAFVAAPGQQLISADYSQIELRLAAHLSGDQALLAAFRAGADIHTATMAAILGVPPEQVTKDQRRQAKAINFGILYGQGAFGLSRGAGLTQPEAETFIRDYFARFPGVRNYLEATKRLAAERGYVETLLGRRRYFPQLSQPAAGREAQAARARAEREAINAPIQGAAADIIKLAMLRLPAALAQAGLAARLLLQVHDELVLECPAAEVPAAAQITRQVMETAFPLDLPLGVEVRAGPNWDEMQAV